MIKKACLFYHVYDCESTEPSLAVLQTEKEPVVVTVRVQVALDQQVVLCCILRVKVGTTEVPALKIGVDLVSSGL